MYEPRADMKGFTLIELTVALSILATLAAVLLPRIAQMQRAARIGNLRSLHGSVSASAMLIHTALLSRNGQPDTRPCAGSATANNQITGAGTVCTEGGLVHTVHGYPASSLTGIASAAGLGAAAAHPADPGYRVSVAAGVTTFARADASQPEHCSFTYTQALDAQTAAAISLPVLTGC
jgi:prepilin-type N-terminal cleavage/methylation domain-containing protein